LVEPLSKPTLGDLLQRPIRACRHLRPSVMIALSLLAIAVYGPQFAAMWRPPVGLYLDFLQDWLSARNYWTDQPIYTTWNAHPPVSVLVVLPFGFVTNYRDAHLLWNLVTFPGYLLALVVLAWNLRIPIRLETVSPIQQ
jgi:hypothetical protein